MGAAVFASAGASPLDCVGDGPSSAGALTLAGFSVSLSCESARDGGGFSPSYAVSLLELLSSAVMLDGSAGTGRGVDIVL